MNLVLVLIVALVVGALFGSFIAKSAYRDGDRFGHNLDDIDASKCAGGIYGAIATIIVALISYLVF